MSDWRFIFIIWTENDQGETEVERRDGSQRAFVERMCRELINARTPVNDVNQDQEAVSSAQPVEADAEGIVTTAEADHTAWRRGRHSYAN